ncbi:ArsR family transcriptional regulator [Streptomyces clavuligerus]|uniref:ArsR family transcriptional regulator n=3 Tax=Streptomyces clavuligerus TaxID=1901 RepID=E2Q0D3_STRCL|nr:ArsR family transcriptional regulator [Streptomyces clavuligerus]
MASLHVLAEPEHHPEAAAWTARAAVADPGLRDELLVFAPLWARFRCRLFFPRSLPLTTGLDEELTALAELSADAFLDLVAPGILGSTAQPVPPARELRPSATAAREYIRRCQRRSYARGELAGQLVAAPLELRDRLLAVLRAADAAFFAEDWRALRPALEEHSREVRRRLAVRPPAEVLTELLPTAVRVGPGARIRLDKLQNHEVRVAPRPLVLIPSARVRPHLTVKNEHPSCVVIQYAARGTVPDEQLTVRDLHHRLMALTSPARMELCRHLLGEPITTSELAARLGSSEPQVSRSLRILREAGLVRSTRDGKLVRHRLATDVIRRLGHDVLATVGR